MNDLTKESHIAEAAVNNISVESSFTMAEMDTLINLCGEKQNESNYESI